MTATATEPSAQEFRENIDDDVLERLLSSSEQLSYDPNTEVDWEAPLDPDKHGMNPQWCSLYGTPLWEQMSREQQIALTRHEAASIASIGIWFEMLLQQMLLVDVYPQNPSTSKVQFALTEIADECRHSIMFARGSQLLSGRHYRPNWFVFNLARLLKLTASREVAYTSILVAEEVLDVMQRDWMRGEDVLDQVRTICKIHVVEESRHMKFARHETMEQMKTVGPIRRRYSAAMISIIGFFIVNSLVRPDAYKAAGLDVKQAKEAAKKNTHHQNLMRLSCQHLMDFLAEARLLTGAAKFFYRRVHML